MNLLRIGSNASLRRRALRAAVVQGGLWSAGNALTTGPLVLYLAQEIGARGLALSVLLAAPNVLGLLRLGAPRLVARCGTARRAALAALSASYVLLAVGLPGLTLWAATGGRWALAGLIVVIVVHQVLEFLGATALWAYLGELAPRAVRGRFLAWRQSWQLAVLVPVLLAGSAFVDGWRARHRDAPERLLTGYALTTGVGAALLLASLLPLARGPEPPRRRTPRNADLAPSVARAGTTSSPWRDRRFAPYLVYRVVFSLANGSSQAAQARYPYAVLGLGTFPLSLMQTGTRLGQLAVTPWLGRWCDRAAARTLLVGCQAIVALGPIFYLLAAPVRPWWIGAAAAAWIAYAGINLAQPKLLLSYPPDDEARPGYVAAAEALSGVAHGVSTIVGGWLLDRLTSGLPSEGAAGLHWAAFAWIFAAGSAARFGAALAALRVREPAGPVQRAAS